MRIPTPVPPSDPTFNTQQRRLAAISLIVGAGGLGFAVLLGKVWDPFTAHARTGALIVFFGAIALIVIGTIMTFAGQMLGRWGNALIAIGVGASIGGLLGLAFVARPESDL